ncbi:MAG: T9SS type A sorting domain-containing protein [Bacteroidia bacterium]
MRALCVTAVLALLYSSPLLAQVNYELSRFTNTYTAITTGGGATQISNAGTGVADFTTSAGATDLDDGAAIIALPMSIEYCGGFYQNSDYFVVGTNGFVSLLFNPGTVTNTNKANYTSGANTSFYSTTAPNATIAPWYDDLGVGSGSVLYKLNVSGSDSSLTIQWTGVPSYYTTATRTINFQVVLYASTHSAKPSYIEFNYGTVSGSTISSTSESASIGIKNATGGNGNYLDAVTGSKNFHNYFNHADNWPGSRSIRFAPNASVSTLSAGSYTVGTAGTYKTLTEAVADVNHRGISGAITLSLQDATYAGSLTGGELFPIVLGSVGTSTNTITIQPASGRSIITSTGWNSSGGVYNTARAGTPFASTTEPILGLLGSDYVTIKNIDFQIEGTGNLLDHGVGVRNFTATDGAQYNTIRDISVTLNRTNTATYGIYQAVTPSPSAATGTNSYNKYYNFTIGNSYNGVYCVGLSTTTAANWDLGNEIGTISGGTSYVGRTGVSNDIGGLTTTSYGINAQNQGGLKVFGCVVQNHTNYTTMYSMNFGLLFNTCEIYNNRIHTTAVASTTTTGANNGLYFSTNPSTSYTGTHEIRIYNNAVSNLQHGYATASTTVTVNGIYIPATTNATTCTFILHHNSVSINTTNTQITSTCMRYTATGATSGPRVVSKNNIFSNSTANQSGTPKHYCIYNASATSVGNGTTASSSNYNVLHLPNTTNGYVGRTSTTDRATIANWTGAITATGQSTVTDANSVSGDPLFGSNIILAPSSGSSSAMSAGTGLSAPFTTDILGATRHASTPTIGAYENSGDFEAPTITYTALSNQTTSNFTTSSFATITDNSAGVNTTSGTRPRLYYKKSTDANAFVGNTSGDNGWKWVEANGTSSPYDFTVDWAIINGGSVSLGNTIQYFVVAQDQATTPNISCNPTSGFVATTVSNISSAPSSPNSFTIVNPPLSGSYNIGTAQTYTTITAALADLSTRGVSAAVTFNLTDASYGSGETFPITLGTVSGASSTNTITLKPATSVNATITAANAGSVVMRFNGTDYFTIDGSNNNSTSRNLTIINNANTATSGVLWLSSQGVGAGCTYFTVKNCNLSCSTLLSSNATIGILVGGTTLSTVTTTGAGADNDNITLQNNSVKAVGFGICAYGLSTGEFNALEIKNNSIGSTGTDVVFTRGIDLVYTTTGSKIYGNEIFNMNINWGASAVTMIGISVGTGCNNTEIYQNKIYDIINTTTSNSTTTGAFGITTGLVTTTTNLSIYNNLIYNLKAQATTVSATSTGGVAGIRLYGGTSNKVYYNTIYLNGSVSHSSASGISFSSCIAVGTTPTTALDVRNNICVNTMELPYIGSSSYAIYYNFTTAFTGLTSNNNCLYGANGAANTTYNAGYYNSAVQNNFATNWQAAHTAASQETGSIGTNPTLNSTSNMVPLSSSPVAGAGSSIGAVTVDYEGTTRGGTPYIGAYEKAGDYAAPEITYSVLGNTGSTTNRTVTATITDNSSGVPTTGSDRPRIWFRRTVPSTSSWASTAGTLASGTGTNGSWDFTIDYSVLSITPTAGETYQYYVVAQDQASTANIGYSPSAGAVHTSVSSQSSAPTTPNAYNVVTPLSTTISVGSGQTYTSLTGTGGLFEAINNTSLGGNTTVNITSDLTEDGTNQLNSPGLAGYTLTIQPSTTSLRTISNSADLSQSMVRLMGVTGVTIDGRSGGSGQYIRIVNTHATSASCYAAIEINGGSTNNMVRNCTLETNATTTSRGTMVIGTTGINSGNTIAANTIRDAVGTPGTVGVPGVAIYIGSSANNGNTTVGGSTAADGNDIYNFTSVGVMNFAATGQTIRYNKVHHNSARSTATYQIRSDAGNDHTISNNMIYFDGGSTTSIFYGIYVVGSSTGHTISNNSIGGAATDRSGTAMSCASTTYCIYLTLGTATASSIQGNTISNFTFPSSNTCYPIYLTAGSANIGTSSGNTIGGLANSYDNFTSSAGTTFRGISIAGSGTVDVQNNTIGNFTTTTVDQNSYGHVGIYSTVSGTLTVKNNTIRDIVSKEYNSSGVTTTPYGPVGMYYSSLSATAVVEGNSIYNLSNTSTGFTTNYHFAKGITVAGGSAGAVVKRNRIYNINVSSANTGATYAPYAMGIHVASGSTTYSNNQISVGNASGNESRAMGVYLNGTGTDNFYYNSIYVSGASTSGTNKTYAFYRAVTSGTKDIRNNIFYNARTGGTGAHCAIGTSSTTGWASVTSNYNLLVSSSASTIGDYAGTNYNFANWQTNSVKDTYSAAEETANVSASNLFTSTSTGNLNIVTGNTECWYINGRAVQISGQTEDYGSASAGRSTTLAAGGSDIGSDEFTPGVNPPNITLSGTIGLGNTQTFTFAGKTVATVTWQSGTLPTSWTTYKYWPGSWPNNTTSGGSVSGAKYSNAYWVLTPDVTTGFTYDVVLYYDDALLGTIAAETDAKLAKMSSGQNWISYASTINTTANTVTMAGLNSFSEFTLNDVNNPLPVEWISFTGKKVFDNVELSWITATEINNSHFEVERSTDGRNFEYVGEVKGAGNSFTPLNYNYTDVAPFGTNSILYYRLKQVDFNGEYEFSKTIAVGNSKQSNGVTIEAINPNPFTEKLNLTLTNVSEGNVTIEVYDLSGRKHYTQTTVSTGQGTLSIDLSSLANLAKGVYIVNIRNGNDAIRQKLVKSR